MTDSIDRTIAIYDKLSKLMIGGCTCLTKTPDIKFHKENCTYRLAREVEALFIPVLSDPCSSRTVNFIGVDPLNLTRGAHHPMIPDSWRFGFYEVNGELRFGHRDAGPLVAIEAIEDQKKQSPYKD